MNAFQIMSEPVRLRLVEVLCLGEHSFGQLADVITAEFGVSRATASWHLAVMKREGWVVTRSDWPLVKYRLDDAAIRNLVESANRFERLWSQRYGWFERRGAPTEALLAPPKDQKATRVPRAPTGTAKGLRGRDRGDNPWRPRV